MTGMSRRLGPDREGTRGPKAGGYILVAVLGTMLLLAGLMGAASLFLRSSLHSARLGDQEAAMAGTTRAGLEVTAYQLFVLRVPPSLVDGRRVHLTGATMVPAVIDEGGKIDLNGADTKLLRSVFLGIMDAAPAEALVAAIVAIRGASATDALPTPGPAAPLTVPWSQLGGSTPDQTPPAPAPLPKKQRGFQSVEQLRGLPGVTNAALKRLTPLLTVFNPDGKVNILTAPDKVLRVLPGLAEPAAAEILTHRRGADKAERERLQAMLGQAIAFAKIKPGPAYTVRIAVTSDAGVTRTIEAVIADSKSVDDPYYILDWRE